MNTLRLSPGEVMAVARRVCTDRQLQVVQLREAGMGWKRISLHLGVGPDTARDHWRAAVRKINKEAERVEVVRSGAAGEAGQGARAVGGDGAVGGRGCGHQSEEGSSSSAGR